MIQNRQCRALSLDARNVAIWYKSGENIYHGLRAVGNSLTTWAISLHGWYEILVRGCCHGDAPSTECHKKVECCASAVVRCRIHRCKYIGFSSRYFSGIGIEVIKSYIWNIISWILTTTIPSCNVGDVCPVWCVRIPLREILRMFVTRNIGIINYCD